MPIKYIVKEELKLLCTLFYGIVGKKDAFEYVTLIKSDKDLDDVQKTIVLLKESELIFNIEDVENFSRKLSLTPSFKNRGKIALLIESPNDTVVATIFSQTIQTLRKGLIVELFYTMDAAIQFLDLTEERAKIDEIIAQQLLQTTLDAS